MIKLFTSKNLLEVDLLRSRLEAQGIRCLVRNEMLRIAQGEVPFADTWPELWIRDDADLAQAQSMLTANPEALAAWKCPHCGEEIEGQFTTCWNCGAERPLVK